VNPIWHAEVSAGALKGPKELWSDWPQTSPCAFPSSDGSRGSAAEPVAQTLLVLGRSHVVLEFLQDSRLGNYQSWLFSIASLDLELFDVSIPVSHSSSQVCVPQAKVPNSKSDPLDQFQRSWNYHVPGADKSINSRIFLIGLHIAWFK
jgi:hypothetical protein